MTESIWAQVRYPNQTLVATSHRLVVTLGDGDEWVINGQKMWCTNADDAAFIVLLCRSQPRNPRNRREGIGSFFIEKEPVNFQGVYRPANQQDWLSRLVYLRLVVR